MGIAPEVIDGERFVRAWTRFRDKFSEDQLGDEHRDMLRQYVETATFYHEKALRAQGLAQGNDLAEALTRIANDAAALMEAKCNANPTSQFRISRASEILKRRRKAGAAAESAEYAQPALDPANARVTDAARAHEGDANTPMMDISYNELKAMMETKKLGDANQSTQEMRRKLGLFDRDAGGHSTASESMVKEEQENIQAEMVNLAKTLKARTQNINQSLVDDVKILDEVGTSAESSAVQLDRENAVLEQHRAASIGFWTSLWLVMAAVMVFMATYIYMKLFSRRL